MKSEIDSKLPIRRLGPGDECKLMMAPAHGDAIQFTVIASWTNPDGTEGNLEEEVSVY